MANITIPAFGWRPRPYQMKLWKYLENGGKRAVCVWARRSGKDALALQFTATQMIEKPGTYWHCLPEASQCRKAIWSATNSHTGRNIVDEVFPHELRESTQNNEMFIKFKNGSTWQLVGSDNFDSLVGSNPTGVIFSEFALAKPEAWAMIRPMLLESNGYAVFISTPRGKNSLWKMYNDAKKSAHWFAELLTVDDTKVFTPEQMEIEREEMKNMFGEAAGEALFNQEYYCDFDAAIPGAYYVAELQQMRAKKQITEVEYDPMFPVMTAWDLGMSDDTAIIFFQVIHGEIRVIDAHNSNGQPIAYYLGILNQKPYKYALHYLPHDARAKTMASGGKSIIEQIAEKIPLAELRITPHLSIQDGIQATRRAMTRMWIDEDKCFDLLEAIKAYQREWDSEKQMFKDKPRHDWTSHYADALRYMSVAWQMDEAPPAPPDAVRSLMVGPKNTMTLEDMYAERRNTRVQRARI